MYCVNCGTQLPNDAAFCLKCGKPQKASTTGFEPARIEEWETCIIKGVKTKRGVFTSKAMLWAEGIRPNGTTYIIAKTPEFELRYAEKFLEWIDNQNESILNYLISQLVNDGWEPFGARGDAWYSHRFRRPLAAERKRELERDDARGLLTYLRKNGVKVTLDSSGKELVINKSKLKRETLDEVTRLEPYLLEILAQEKGSK